MTTTGMSWIRSRVARLYPCLVARFRYAVFGRGNPRPNMQIHTRLSKITYRQKLVFPLGSGRETVDLAPGSVPRSSSQKKKIKINMPSSFDRARATFYNTAK